MLLMLDDFRHDDLRLTIFAALFAMILRRLRRCRYADAAAMLFTPSLDAAAAADDAAIDTVYMPL